MQLKPTQYYILVSLQDVPSPSSIVLPEGQRRSPYGLVLDIGPDVTFVKINDKVLFLPDNLIGFEGYKEYILPESSVFAFLEDTIVDEDDHTEVTTP